MDADTKQAITHPSLKLIGGTGAIVLVAGVVIWGATHRAKTGAGSTSSPTGSDIGTFAPTTLTVNVPPAAFPTSSPGSSTGPSAPPSGSGNGTSKPPTHGSGGGKRPPVRHPHVTHSTPAHTSHPAARHTRGGSGAGGSKSSGGFAPGSPTSNYYFPTTGTSDFPGPQNGSSNSVPVLSGVGDFIGSLFGSPAS